MKAIATTSRIPSGRGEVDPKALPRGPEGRAMCRCGCGREVPPREIAERTNEQGANA